jgi:CRISPR-associated protein Csx14
MAESDIPVDLFNPGQVFSCLGFLEAADILLGDAEGGFDWRDKGDAKFRLRAGSDRDPFEAVLSFLAEAEIIVVSPAGVDGPWPDGSKPDLAFPASDRSLRKSDGKGFSVSALPIQLRHDGVIIPVSHWLKHDSLQTLKLFAGQQVAATLAINMLCGDDKKKGSKGFKHIYADIREQGFQDPFNFVCAVGGRFGFDARGGWDSIRIGTSLDQRGALVEVSPHVELLAAMGLENSRPVFLSTYQIRYAAWMGLLPLILCRVAMFSPDAFLPKDECRFFRTHLGEDKQYKKMFFAEEETYR